MRARDTDAQGHALNARGRLRFGPGFRIEWGPGPTSGLGASGSTFAF